MFTAQENMLHIMLTDGAESPDPLFQTFLFWGFSFSLVQLLFSI
jgi:hypothetical protein